MRHCVGPELAAKITAGLEPMQGAAVVELGAWCLHFMAITVVVWVAYTRVQLGSCAKPFVPALCTSIPFSAQECCWRRRQRRRRHRVSDAVGQGSGYRSYSRDSPRAYLKEGAEGVQEECGWLCQLSMAASQ